MKQDLHCIRKIGNTQRKILLNEQAKNMSTESIKISFSILVEYDSKMEYPDCNLFISLSYLMKQNKTFNLLHQAPFSSLTTSLQNSTLFPNHQDAFVHN